MTLSKSPQRGLYVILTGTIGLAELMGLRFTVGKCLYLDMHLTLAFLQPLLQVGLQQRCVERDVGELVAEEIGGPILGVSPRQTTLSVSLPYRFLQPKRIALNAAPTL